MTIYYIKNNKTNKLYIGRTTQNPPSNRFYQHMWALRNETVKRYNRLMINDFNKYGEESFEFGILEEGFETIDELDDAEEFWITTLQTNINNYNIKIGGPASDVTCETKKILKNAHSIPVLQYNFNGELIGLYGSITNASIVTGCHISTISRSAKTKDRLSGGFKWKFLDGEVKFNIGKQKTSKEAIQEKLTKKVKYYDKNGKFIKLFKSVTEASEELNIHVVTIRRVACNKEDRVYGCNFKYA